MLIRSLVIGLALFPSAVTTAAEPRWQTLPPTPALPQATQSGHAPVNGIRIWFAVYGRGDPVVLLHGGLANSDYWGLQVPELAKRHQVIVMDSRGHGRSTRDEKPIGYHLMASDVIALLNHLKIKQAAIVGWSDGAIIGLDLAIHHPERLTRLFAFAANSDPTGVKDVTGNKVFDAYLARAAKEYETLSATPKEYAAFQKQIFAMWLTQPKFTADNLKSIKVPTWIVDGDRDEAIKRENTLFMADQIPNAGLLIQPEVSHFSFLQNPRQFNEDLLRFLDLKH